MELDRPGCCSAPDDHVTGETAETVEAATLRAKLLTVALPGRDPLQIESIWHELRQAGASRSPAALAAVDIALHDLRGADCSACRLPTAATAPAVQ
jgi:L-alanine-DL-glutamate epimerase-like enolase superfamily enzyme